MLHSRASAGDGPVTVRAVNRFVGARRKRHLRRGAALGADCVVHRPLAGLGTTIALASLTARGATGGLVLEAFLSVEVLFTGGEDELRAAVPASQGSVLIGHLVILEFRHLETRKLAAANDGRPQA